jgi:putative ABC transport system permease protein
MSKAAAVSSPLLVLRFSARALRGGLSGFWVFIACLALGVAAIVTVITLSDAMLAGLSREGRAILGGDAAFSLVQRAATPQERAWLEARGRLSEIVLLRAMARSEPGEAALVEVKAIDRAYPLAGQLSVSAAGGASEVVPETLFAPVDGVRGALVEPALAARLSLQPGARFRLGETTLRLAGEIAGEPDKLATGLALGPRVIIDHQALADSGLIQPGSLMRTVYRVLLPPGGDDAAALTMLTADAKKAFPDAGWSVRTRENASPGLARNLERFSQFLTLVGLTALLVGGVGIANATRAYVDRRRLTFATLKSLGATGRFVFLAGLAEVMALAALGIVLGVAVGALLPPLVAHLGAGLLPFALETGFDGRAMALGALYGLLTAFTFAVWPLGRAHDIPVSTLFRDEIGTIARLPRRGYVVAVAMGGLLLGAAALGFADDRRIAVIYAVAAVLTFIGLRLIASAIMWIAARLPHARRMPLRLALAALHKPGALTPSVVLSLGLGLTLLVALGAIEGSIRGQLDEGLPGKAPSFFFLDIPRQDADGFAALLRARAPDGGVEQVPMLRGRITALNGVPVDKAKPDEKAAWVLTGDRGITYSAGPPDGTKLTEGAWWGQDYHGEPLVSFGDELAAGLGLKIGDTVTVNVLGRPITARIANLRRIDWQSLGINFVMVFSPNTFSGAPHTSLATLTLPPGRSAGDDAAIVRAVADRYPAISTVRVKDALEAIGKLVGQLALALSAAGGLAILASVLVLAGALAAGQRARIHEAVILKTLGATRLRLLAAFLLEYGVLGLITAVFGAVAGSTAAYFIVVEVMDLPFSPSLSGVATGLIFALLVTISLGLAQTFRILGEKPAPYLREL